MERQRVRGEGCKLVVKTVVLKDILTGTRGMCAVLHTFEMDYFHRPSFVNPLSVHGWPEIGQPWYKSGNPSGSVNPVWISEGWLAGGRRQGDRVV